MDLLYKPDWQEAKQRFEAWWAHEALDRCIVQVTAPKADAPPEDPPTPPERAEDRWLDHAYVARLNEWRMRRTFYGGEAFPVWNPGHAGWACISCCLGAPVELTTDTAWIYPVLDQGELTDHDYHDLKIDPENPWWRRAQDMLRFAAEQSRGKSVPSMLAIGGCGDTLAALRGTEMLLADLMDCPDYVREFDLYLMRQWIEVHSTLHSILAEASEGSTCWFELWSPGRFYAAQNDFAYMISPRVFREVFLPSIRMQTDYLDHTIYHVDGVGNFAHVEALCELPRLQALQILPGAGKPSPLHYVDVLRQVQNAGKNLHITIQPSEVETAVRELSATGLCISTWAETEDQARALIDVCRRYSRP